MSVVVLVGIAFPAPAGAGWSPAETVSTGDWELWSQPALAVGADGTVALAWEDSDDVQVAVLEPGGEWSPPLPLGQSGDQVGEPGISVTPEGGVLVAWPRNGTHEGSGVAFRYRPPGGRFGAPGWAALEPHVGVVKLQTDRQGRVSAYYERNDDSVWLTEWTPASGWTSAVRLLPASGYRSEPLYAFAPTGTAVLVWDELGVQYATTRSRSGQPFSTFRLTSTGNRASGTLPPVMSPAGIATLRWVEAEGVSDVLVRKLADLQPGGQLEPVDAPPGGLASSEFGWSGDERAIALSARSEPGEYGEERYVKFASERSAEGAWSEPVRAFEGDGGHEQMALDGVGRLFWLARGSDPQTGLNAIRAAVRGTDGTWSNSRTVSPTDRDVYRPVLAVAGDGHAAAAWARRARERGSVQVAIWEPGPDAPAPPPPPLAAPPTPLDHSAAYLADNARTGRIEGAGLHLPLSPAWSHTDTEGLTNGHRVVADGLAYVFHRSTFEEPWGVSALDVETGRPEWTTVLDGESGSGPGGLVLSAGAVFVSGRGHVWALDGRTGAIRWRSEPLFGWSWSPSPPAVSGDLVVMQSGGIGSTIYAFDATTGERRWRWTSDGKGPVTIGAGLAMLTSDCGRSSGWTLPDGRPAWYRDEEGSTCGGGGPAAYDGAWLWGEGGRVQDAATGAVVGRFGIGGAPALYSPYAITVDPTVGLVAYHQRTLKRVWTFTPKVSLDKGPLVVDGVVYVASARDRVFALDPITGALRWSAATQGDVLNNEVGSLAAARGHLLIPVAGGVEAFRTGPGPRPAINPDPEAGPESDSPVPAPGPELPPRAAAGAEPELASGLPTIGATPRTRACRTVRAGHRVGTGIRATRIPCAAARRQVRRQLNGRRSAWRCVRSRKGRSWLIRCTRSTATVRFSASTRRS